MTIQELKSRTAQELKRAITLHNEAHENYLIANGLQQKTYVEVQRLTRISNALREVKE